MLTAALASLGDQTPPRWVLPGVLLFAVLIRALVSTHPHSGQGEPPMFGDYEAQRHWMEVTLNTPLSQWYVHTKVNDLQYWGLDYPPLTAFQSWICGVWMRAVEPSAVALTTSRGWETPVSKLAMRATVIASDLAFTLPATIAFVRAFYGEERGGNANRMTWATALILLAPAPILVDHGHFQYNNWSLGLTTYAVAAIVRGRNVLGSVLFTAALCHKQMSLYHAPAFFAHLLGVCLVRGRGDARKAIVEVAKLGAAVVLTVALHLAPFYVADGAGVTGVAAVLTRLAPFKRGLFEDYVANFWCATSPIVKWRTLLSIPAAAKLSAAVTACAMAPAMYAQIAAPSPEGFLWCMACVSMSFFLFSFQVHEKSVLLPALPVSMLCLRATGLATFFMPVLVCVSMWPLLRKDGLGVAYVGCVVLFVALFGDGTAPERRKPPPPPSPKRRWLPGWIPSPGKRRTTPGGDGGNDDARDGNDGGGGGARRHEWAGAGPTERRGWIVAGRALAAVAVASHAWEAIGPPPPPSLPHLHALAFTELGFVGFLGVYAYCYVRLWACARDVGAGKLKAN